MGAVARKPRPRRDGRPGSEERQTYSLQYVLQRSDEAARRSEGIGFRSRQPFHTSLLGPLRGAGRQLVKEAPTNTPVAHREPVEPELPEDGVDDQRPDGDHVRAPRL